MTGKENETVAHSTSEKNGTEDKHTEPPSTTNTRSKSLKEDLCKQCTKERPSFEYEFGGPVGALATTVMLPIVTLVLLHFADEGRVDVSFLFQITSLLSSSSWRSLPLPLPEWLSPSLVVTCTAVLVGWFGFQVTLERWLPAELIEGTVLPKRCRENTNTPWDSKEDPSMRKETRLLYRVNGHLAFWVTLLVIMVGYPTVTVMDDERGLSVSFHSVPLTFLHDHLGVCAVCTIVFCFAMSTFFYVKSFADDALLARGGNSGYACYDFFMGRELNPRPTSSWWFCNFDWKEFCELRPGLMGWMLFNLAGALKQRQLRGDGTISGSMILVNVFQGLYVWDALYQERAILTTMDITTDGFGFMLCFGDLGWVPFTYCLQARYLVRHDPHLGPWSLGAIVLAHLGGYYIFRSANSQKDAFRRDPYGPTVAHLKYLETKRGTKLLTSGWWGLARKINYTGDWIMGLSWCLTCGIDSVVPYYYAIYFAILLTHRSIRDDHMCKEKYGDDWEEYKRLVPYRFIPGII